MAQTLHAVYEKGVLRPLEPLNLREQQLVTLTLLEAAPDESWLDIECVTDCARDADDGVTIEEVRQGLAKLPGSLTEDFIAEREDR